MKEILLSGGSVSFPYKEKPKEWVGTAKISGFSGGFGIKPKVIVEVPCIEIHGRKEFDFKEIDEAIKTFNNLILRPKNICYKMTESMIELYNQGDTDLDLDDVKDLKKVRKLQKQKQNEIQ